MSGAIASKNSEVKYRPGQAEKEALLRKADAKEAEEKKSEDYEKFIPPTFTIKQLLDAIPAHCFHRSALHSSAYILQDFIVIGGCAWAWFQVPEVVAGLNLPPLASSALHVAAKSFLSITAGMFMTGLWIIAHECGHQAFSSSKSINNFVGWVLHSFLLVPYHSWRISHAKHHAATGHLTRDEVFVPRTRKEMGVPAMKEEAELEGINVSKARQIELREAVSDAPLYVLTWLLAQQLFGWPLYLIRNASGQKRYPKMTNHFQPSSVIFKPEHAPQIIWSDFGLVIMLAALGYWSYMRSFSEMFLMFGLSYLQVNHWLVAITFLQHTDPLLPHYSANKWTFARGALATIDRQFLGPIGWIAMHGICETHVSHHISSKIPHYNAWEATEALKAYCGPYYMKSDENFLVSLYSNFKTCRWVEEGTDVVFFKNASGVAKRVAVEEYTDSGVDLSADQVEDVE